MQNAFDKEIKALETEVKTQLFIKFSYYVLGTEKDLLLDSCLNIQKNRF